MDDNLPECSIFDETRFNQIVINLLSNAVKFTPDNGIVRLEGRFLRKTQTIVIDVIDNGIGIAEENIGKIFNAFEQEDSWRYRFRFSNK